MRMMFPFAEAAALAANPDGTIGLAVRAGSSADTERAAALLAQRYRLKLPAGSDAIGPENFWHGRVLRDDRHLLVVLGSDKGAAMRRAAAVPGLPTEQAQADVAFGERLKTIVKYSVFAWAGMQFFIFGRVASWAGGEPAVPGVEAVSAETLMRRLLSLNDQDVPYALSRGRHANEIVIDWRYADAKWADLMRLHGMLKTYRLVLRFDEGQHNVRAQDRYASFDWSAGLGAALASLQWKVSLGITFYEYGHERVFGLQFRDGMPTFDLTYSYTFNLNEMKQPVIEIIRHAGWNFRPVITFFRPVGG